MTLSHIIQDARKKRGMTLRELAQAVGYDPSHLGLLEKGVRRLDEEAAVRVALVLGIDPTTALMAAVRERLPEGLRHHVPASTTDDNSRGDDHNARLAASREIQAEHFDFEIKRSHMHVTSDWDGNVRFVRTLEECRPNAALRPVSQITFRERAVGAETSTEDKPEFVLLRSPKGLEFQSTSTVVGSWVHHRLFFPQGWRRKTQQKDDAFSFKLESHRRGGLFLATSDLQESAQSEGVKLDDPNRGILNVYVRHHIQRLEVTVELPRGYEPARWQPWVRWGRDEFESGPCDIGDRACRSMIFRPDRNIAKLTVYEPLAGYTFSIRWTPLDHQHYLEARYGGSKK